MINLVHADQPRRKLEHVVPEGNHDELRVLGAFFDVGCYDGNLGGWLGRVSLMIWRISK